MLFNLTHCPILKAHNNTFYSVLYKKKKVVRSLLLSESEVQPHEHSAQCGGSGCSTAWELEGSEHTIKETALAAESWAKYTNTIAATIAATNPNTATSGKATNRLTPQSTVTLTAVCHSHSGLSPTTVQPFFPCTEAMFTVSLKYVPIMVTIPKFNS